MTDQVKLLIELDESVKNNPIFSALKEITLEKPVIFEYGILNIEVPADWIGENAFEYLEGKIPHLEGLYSDHIRIIPCGIINNARGEDKKIISEIIGVGVGLYYAKKLFGINKNEINKIQTPPKGKYLDFRFFKSGQIYECETKGITNINNLQSKISDTVAKKKDQHDIACRFGVITLAGSPNREDSKIVVCDDYDNVTSNQVYNIYHYIEYYQFVISLILDNPAYNKLVKALKNKKVHSRALDATKIIGKYVFRGEEYLGKYFDKRLILNLIKENLKKGMDRETLFKRLTDKIGKEKYFLGISKGIVHAINNRDMKYLGQAHEHVVNETNNRLIILGEDGIIFVKSVNGEDEQVEAGFTDEQVKNKLDLISNFITRRPHQCGAPCRSKEIEGKPCDIMTFREHCHFHR